MRTPPRGAGCSGQNTTSLPLRASPSPRSENDSAPAIQRVPRAMRHPARALRQSATHHLPPARQQPEPPAMQQPARPRRRSATESTACGRLSCSTLPSIGPVRTTLATHVPAAGGRPLPPTRSHEAVCHHGQSTCPSEGPCSGSEPRHKNDRTAGTFGRQGSRQRRKHGAHTLAQTLQEHRAQTMARTPEPPERIDSPPETIVSKERARLLLVSHDARHFLNRPASIPCCLILRWRVL